MPDSAKLLANNTFDNTKDSHFEKWETKGWMYN